MHRFTNILFLYRNLPESNEALDQAIILAKINSAKIRVIEIVALHDENFIDQVKQSYRRNIAESIRHRYGGEGSDLLRKLKDSGLNAECKFMTEFSSQRVLNEVMKHDHDLVVVGVGDNRDYLGDRSGIMINLIRRCAVPVWIAKAGTKKKSGRILAAVDPAPAPGPFTESANLLNSQIMLTANNLALMGNHGVDVLHCWMQPMEERLRVEFASKSKVLDNVLSSTRRRHRRWLNYLLKSTKIDQIAYRIHLKKGKAHELIPDFARRQQIDLVIMGNFGRTGADSFFDRNTAEEMLCRSDVSLLVVKPWGFNDFPGLSVADSEAVCELG